MKISTRIRQFLADDRGSVALEYGVLTGLVSVTAITGLEALGQETASLFHDLARQIDGVVAAMPG